MRESPARGSRIFPILFASNEAAVAALGLHPLRNSVDRRVRPLR